MSTRDIAIGDGGFRRTEECNQGDMLIRRGLLWALPIGIVFWVGLVAIVWIT